MRIPSGVTDQYIYFVAVDATDLKTRETGLSSFTVYRSRNNGTATVMTTPTVAELSAANMPGVYSLLLDEDMTIDSGDDSQEMCFHITATGMAPVTKTIELYRSKITAGNTLTVSGGNANSAVQTIAANAITATAIASNAITAAKIATDAITAAKIAANAITSAKIATDAIGAAQIAANAIGASELATDAVNEIVDQVWNELQSEHVTAGSFGEIATEIADILVDTAEIGAAGAGLTEAGGTGDQLSAVPWNSAWAAQVNAEVVDAINVDTYAEPGQGAPAATASLVTKINYLYKSWRNKKEQTSSTFSLYDDAGTTVDQKSTVSDNGTTATRGEIVTGP